MSNTDQPTPPLPPTEHIAQFFAFAHLPPHLAAVSRPFAELADKIIAELPRNPERTVALRKLLEAKDAAVRAVVAKSSAIESGRALRDGPPAITTSSVGA